MFARIRMLRTSAVISHSLRSFLGGTIALEPTLATLECSDSTRPATYPTRTLHQQKNDAQSAPTVSSQWHGVQTLFGTLWP
jgi:hypothetical protein